MKIVNFEHRGRLRYGCVTALGVIDLQEALASASPPLGHPLERLSDFLDAGSEALSMAHAVVDRLRSGDAGIGKWVYPTTEVRLRAPVSENSKIIGVGRNYRDHAAETGSDLPDIPRIFPKFHSSVIGPDDDIVKPDLTDKLDWEVELAVVIGKHAAYVPEEDALDYVAGVTLLNDISARDIQKKKPEQLTLGKNFRTFSPIGPWIVTLDEIPDLSAIRLRTMVNGRVMQDSSTSHMIFSVPQLVSFLSSAFDLQPGDIIATGTPSGVGLYMDPPTFLDPGDVVTIDFAAEGEVLGELSNPVTKQP